MSAALTPEQRAILEQRGVLAPEEIHRLASKTRRAMGGDRGQRASCHSDLSVGRAGARAPVARARSGHARAAGDCSEAPETFRPGPTAWAGAKRPSLAPPWLSPNNPLFGSALPVLEVFLRLPCTFSRVQQTPETTLVFSMRLRPPLRGRLRARARADHAAIGHSVALRSPLWLALGGWVGSWALFALVIARLAFRVLPSPEIAGQLVGPDARRAALVRRGRRSRARGARAGAAARARCSSRCRSRSRSRAW